MASDTLYTVVNSINTESCPCCLFPFPSASLPPAESVLATAAFYSSQYFTLLQARLKALNNVYGDVEVEEQPPKIRYNYPKPISAPVTPNPSRSGSPEASDNEDEGNLSHDSDEEEKELDLAAACLQKLKAT